LRIINSACRSDQLLDTRIATVFFTWYPQDSDDSDGWYFNKDEPDITVQPSRLADPNAADFVYQTLSAIVESQRCPRQLLHQRLEQSFAPLKQELMAYHAEDRYGTSLATLLPFCTSLAMTDIEFDWVAMNLVPPDMFSEVKGKDWYKLGVLREWHERRRRGIANEVYCHSWEERNNLVPSYEVDSEIHDTTRPGCEQEDRHNDMRMDEGDNEDSDRRAESDEPQDVLQRSVPGPSTEIRGTHNMAQAPISGDIVRGEHRSHKRKRTDSTCGDARREPDWSGRQ